MSEESMLTKVMRAELAEIRDMVAPARTRTGEYGQGEISTSSAVRALKDKCADLEKRLAESEANAKEWEDSYAEQSRRAAGLCDQLSEAQATISAMREALTWLMNKHCDNSTKEACGECFGCMQLEPETVRAALSPSAGADFEARIWNEAVETCAKAAEAFSNELNGERGSDGSEGNGAFWTADHIRKLKREAKT